MKRLVLAATLALGLHALLLAAKVEWTKEESISPTYPIRLTLSYKTPEIQETFFLSRTESPAKASDFPARENLKYAKRETVPKQKQVLPKKTSAAKEPEQKTFPEIREAAEAVAAKPVADEKVETASWVETPASIPPPLSTKPVTSDIPSSSLPPPGSGTEQSPAPSRQAVPLYLQNPSPEYPPAARRRGYEGTVMMEVFVDSEGKVRNLRLSESSGHDMLDRAAMWAVKDWMFEPARQGEEKVDMWVKVPLTFRLKE